MPYPTPSPICPAVARPRSPVDILNWNRQVLRLPELSSGEKCAGICIGGYVNGKSGYAWPGLATVAEDCGVSIQTARRAAHKLQRLGLLHIEARPGTSSRYHLGSGTEVETPITDDSTPLSPVIAERATERTNPPNPPEGGIVDKSTKPPAPTPQATRTTPASNPVYPRRRRRQVEPPVFAGCHRPADPAYLSPPPARTDRRAAAAAVGGLRAALGVARE
jgi:hypothetical protein